MHRDFRLPIIEAVGGEENEAEPLVEFESGAVVAYGEMTVHMLCLTVDESDRTLLQPKEKAAIEFVAFRCN
jgi:hypothetical protein